MSTNFNRPMAKLKAPTARTAALVFAAALIAAPVLAQRHASPRGGGSGGGGSASGGGGHRSAGPSASAPSSRGGGGGGGGNRSGDGHRPPGSGGGAPHRPPGYDHDGGHGHGGYYGGYYGGGYYSPYYYPYYGFSFGFGYGYPYYYSPYYYGYGYYPYSYGYRPYYYGYQPYYYPPAYSYGDGGYAAPYGGGGGGYVAPYGEGTAYDRASLGAVAVRVKPKNAEVYVDGRYVGATGSFDGFPSYLWVAPGQHRIEVVQVGYANLEQDIEVGSGQVVEIDRDLQRGESVRPAPPTDRYSPRGSERAPYPNSAPYPDNESYEGDDYRAPAPRTEPPRQSPDQGRDPGRYENTDLGGLFLEVRPDDASVYLDGRFVGTGRDVSTATEALRLVPGEHRLQVIHPNYSNQERTIEVGAGEEKRVEVFLGRGAGV